MSDRPINNFLYVKRINFNLKRRGSTATDRQHIVTSMARVPTRATSVKVLFRLIRVLISKSR